jgi:hypothetical protein
MATEETGKSEPHPGRRARTLESYCTLEWVAPEGLCSHCSQPLTIQQHRERPLQTLKAHHVLVMKDRRCPSKECPGWNTIHRPVEEGRHVLRGREYGIDVISLVGEARHHDELSFPRIFQTLTKKYNVIISERHLPNLFQLYLAIVRCRSLEDEVVVAKLRAQNRLILSSDAVRLDETSPPLYVVREVLSGEILCAARIESPTTQALIEFISPIKKLGVPVQGIIIDKEPASVAAFEKVFPEVPLQICQTHYLKNLVKPMESDLSTLANEVRDVVTEVRDLKLAAAKSTDCDLPEREVVITLCEAVQAVGKSHAGDKLFEPPALKRFQRITELAEDTKQVLKQKKGNFPLLARLLVILAALNRWGELSRRLERQFQVIREIAHILNLSESGAAVTLRLRAFLDKLLEDAPKRGRGAPRGQFYRQVVAVSGRFWKGLFHCYDNPDLPRNNNALEQFYGSLKQQARRIHGRKSTSGGPLESFAPYILQIWARLEERPHLEKLLEGLSTEKLKAARKELEDLAAPARRRRAFLRAPRAQTGKALERFLASSPASES